MSETVSRKKMAKRTITNEEREFLWQSNLIESEKSAIAMTDAEKAWSYAKSLVGKNVVVNDVLEIHKILMKNIRPDIAGHFRTCAVRIGYQFKEEETELELGTKVSNCLKHLNRATKLLKIEAMLTRTKNRRRKEAEQTHIEFENIHPFEDGNGRTGRILLMLHWKKLNVPINVIHADYDTMGMLGEQGEYYNIFR